MDTDENHEARNAYTEITRRYHELELELRRLENEREELTAAYKEAEAVRRVILFYFKIKYSNMFYLNQGRKAEEQRSQRLASEYGQFRHDAERRLIEKDEEVESIR